MGSEMCIRDRPYAGATIAFTPLEKETQRNLTKIVEESSAGLLDTSYSSTVIASKISEHVDMINSGHNPVGLRPTWDSVPRVGAARQRWD